MVGQRSWDWGKKSKSWRRPGWMRRTGLRQGVVDGEETGLGQGRKVKLAEGMRISLCSLESTHMASSKAWNGD